MQAPEMKSLLFAQSKLSKLVINSISLCLQFVQCPLKCFKFHLYFYFTMKRERMGKDFYS